MANRRRSAIVVGFLAPALACTAVTGLGKSYEYVNDGGASTGDASTADSAEGRDGSKAEGSTGIMCPALVSGAYTMTNQGDCVAFDKNSKECISTTMSVVNGNCSLQFSSPGLGITGTLEAQADGSFKTGLLVIGGFHHAGCTAIWKPLAATLTVTCPQDAGASTSNACTITLTRTALVCT